MTEIPKLTGRLEHLDMMRGCAASLVMLGHVRSFGFVSLSAVSNPTLLDRAFYAMTALGAESVIVFFVLSGYLVGGKVIADMLADRWRWDKYVLRRLTRLGIVLAPALVLTAGLDWLGLHSGAKGYGGEFFTIYFVGPTSENNHLFGTWLGNLFFLQGITVPVFGSNGPLWSLANEFWYYVLFPLIAFVALVRRHLGARIIAAAMAGILLFWLPGPLLTAGLIWAAGAAGAWAVRYPKALRVFELKFYGPAVLSFFILAILYMKLPNARYPEFVLGLAVALCLPALATMRSPGRLYDATARGLSEISYTLYLTRFPLLALIFFTFVAPVRFVPGASAVALYVCVAAIAVIWAIAVWWCFERHTDRIFRFVSEWVGRIRSRTRVGFGWEPPNLGLPPR